jgi:hypothetical protein
MTNNTQKTKPKTKSETKTKTYEDLARREFRKSPDFASLYVNSTTFGHTKFDFQIVFGRTDVSRDKNSEYTEELAVVAMTPEYAKALFLDFGKVLENYEKEYGEIVLRPHILNKPE